MQDNSKVNIKSTEISERTFNINHNIAPNESLVIAVRDANGDTKILLDVTAGNLYLINLNATISDNKIEE